MLLTEEQLYTVQDYEGLGEGAPYQLIGGELIMTPSPSFFHQSIQYKLANVLGPFAERNKLGIVVGAPLDVFFGVEDVYQPDLIFIRREKTKNLTKDKLRVVPDLVIEILSPATAYYDFTRKKEIYCASGVTEYWIVDPEAETIEVMVKHGEIYQTEQLLHKSQILESAMFPGFTMKVEDVFAF
jgi:Uma2 family endonuclease